MGLRNFSTIFVLLMASFVCPSWAATLNLTDLPEHLRYLLEGDLDTWEAPKEIAEKYPYYLSGYDEENRPIWVIEFGKYDFKSALEKGGQYTDDFNKYIDQYLFRVIRSIGSKSDDHKEMILISDMEGFSIDQLNSPDAIAYHIKQTRRLFQLFKYLNTAFVINTNYLAEGLLNLVRPLYGPEFNRLEIYGTNPAKWRPALLKKIPADQLPEWYGGSKDFRPVLVSG